MKKDTISLQAVADKYSCTLTRACTEILAASGREKRHMTAVIRKQHIPIKLIEKADAYRSRKSAQLSAIFAR